MLGYKQLHEIERVNRDLKHTVDVRPVYHRRSDRIKAHVLLCWLALLLIRVTKNETGRTWHQPKKTMWSLMAARHQTQHGRIAQTTRPTKAQKSVLAALQLKAPAVHGDPDPREACVSRSHNPYWTVTGGSCVHRAENRPFLCSPTIERQSEDDDALTPAS